MVDRTRSTTTALLCTEGSLIRPVRDAALLPQASKDAGRTALTLARTAPRAGRFLQFVDRCHAGLDPFQDRLLLDPLADADRFETFNDLLLLL